MSRSSPTRPTRTGWWLLVVSAALVLLYSIGWAVYADQHLRPHYARTAAGAPADARGSTWRLLGLTTTASLASSSGGPPAVPDPGAVWVLADLEVTPPAPADGFTCELQLLGPDAQVWERTFGVPVQRASTCDPEQLVDGKPYRFESVFLVPARSAHDLGVLLPDSSTAAPTPVLMPPV